MSRSGARRLALVALRPRQFQASGQPTITTVSARRSQESGRPNINRHLTALLLFWLVGACLRITVLAVPPVVPLLHAALHLSETGIGWLASLPPMLFAVAAVPGSLLI